MSGLCCRLTTDCPEPLLGVSKSLLLHVGQRPSDIIFIQVGNIILNYHVTKFDIHNNSCWYGVPIQTPTDMRTTAEVLEGFSEEKTSN